MSRAMRISSVAMPLSNRREDDVERERDDQPDEGADDAGEETVQRATPGRVGR